MELPIFIDDNLLTHSCVATWMTCARKYYLRYRLGISTVATEALRIGTAFHAGAEAGSAELVRGVIEQYYAEAGQAKQEELAVEKEIAIALTEGWYEHYKNDEIIEMLHREIAFNLPIINPETGSPTPSYRQAGKIDAIGRLPDGRVCLIERKTVSESLAPDSDYWMRLLMDSQISRYFNAAKAMGHQVETVIYDVVRKPAIRPSKLTKAEVNSIGRGEPYYGLSMAGQVVPERESPAMFAARLRQDLKDRPEFYFARKEVARLEHNLEAYKREQWVVQRQIRDAEIYSRKYGSAAWPRNTGACVHPYRCQFLDICANDIEAADMLPVGFVRAQLLHPELKGNQDAKTNG